MKRTSLLLALVASLVLMLTIGCTDLVKVMAASPEVVENSSTFRMKGLPSFNAIEARQGIEVTHDTRGKAGVVVTTNLKDTTLLNIRVEGKTLIIAYQPQVTNLGHKVKTTVSVSAADIVDYQASSAASIEVREDFYLPRTLSFRASSAGSIRARNFEATSVSVKSSSAANIFLDHFSTRHTAVDVSSGASVQLQRIGGGNLSTEVSSGASLSLSGHASDGKLSASSGASLDAAALHLKTATATASSGASVTLNAEQANTDASSGGSVKNVFKRK